MKRYAGDIDIFNIPKKPIKDKEPLTNGLDNRFRTDILINGKTNFEKDNNIINSMSDEIISLKEKLSLSFVIWYEILSVLSSNEKFPLPFISSLFLL